MELNLLKNLTGILKTLITNKMKEKNKESIKDRVVNMILDNGIAITLTVAFCIFLYYVMHQQQEFESQLFIKALEEQKAFNRDLLDELIDCLKQ